MRVKAYLFAVSLCYILPFMAQGANLFEEDPPPGPRSSFKSIIVETESGMLTLHFRSDMDEVCVLLQEVTGAVEYELLIDTSIQNQTVLTTSAGTYVLIITDAAGNVIQQEIVVVP